MEKATNLASTFRGDEVITISLKDGGRFNMQKALLCHTSNYFNAALNKGFAEGENKILVFPGYSTKTFELFLYWVCNLELPEVPWEGLSVKCSKHDAILDEIQSTLVQLWAVADMLILPRLQNAVIKSLSDAFQDVHVRPEALRMAFESTAVDSAVVRYLVSQCFESCTNGAFNEAEKRELDSIPGLLAAFIAKIQEQTEKKLCEAYSCEHLLDNLV